MTLWILRTHKKIYARNFWLALKTINWKSLHPQKEKLEHNGIENNVQKEENYSEAKIIHFAPCSPNAWPNENANYKFKPNYVHANIEQMN